MNHDFSKSFESMGDFRVFILNLVEGFGGLRDNYIQVKGEPGLACILPPDPHKRQTLIETMEILGFTEHKSKWRYFPISYPEQIPKYELPHKPGYCMRTVFTRPNYF